MPAMAKVSITIDKDKLRMLRKRAKRLHGGNLSAVIDEATEHLRRLEAMGDYLERIGAPELTDEQYEDIRAEWHGQPKPKRRKRSA
ncbi:MAG: hypothetical protein ACLQBL_22770 [Polyangiaceae bacterium]|jgi:hypothetical protein